ncbi:hypothetical protein LNP25_23095 [Klebsiella variicola subsp. variicola]|nr:hypothetical protein [Klebsiella variicola subsp. variicola]
MFQLSADAGDLGRTYSSELSVVGDIKSSLKVLLPELEKANGKPSPVIINAVLKRRFMSLN